MNRVIRTLLTASLSFVARIMRAYSARVTANGGVVEATACATSTLTSLDSKSLLQSATFVLAPSGYKSGVIYSQVPSNGNGDLTVTRATTATRVNSSGVIETVSSGVPQLDYSLGGCPNFLFEPLRQNMALNSDVGTTQSITVVSGRVYTLSFYGTGSITYSGAASGTLNGTGANNRVSVTITASTTSITLTVTGSVVFLQFEGTGGANPANYPTSYIPTTSAAVPRNTTNFTRSNINGLISASGGTWFVELRNNVAYTRDAVGTGLFIDTDTNSFTNGINIRNQGVPSTRLIISKWILGVGTVLFTTTTDTVKIAIKWNGTTADIFANGAKVVSATSFTPTAMQFLNCINGQVPIFIQQMALWNTPLSDAQCISLSSYTTFEVAKQLLDKVIADAIADGGTYKQSNYDASIDKIVKVMEAFGTTNIASKMVAWVDPEYLPYRQSTEAGTASLSGCRKLYDLFRRADFSQTTPASMPLLLLHSGDNYWWNGGVASNYCSTPSATANQIVGDICFTAFIQPFLLNITPAVIIAKYGTSGNRAFQFRLNNATLQLLVSVGGIDSTATSSTNVPFAANQPFYVRAFRQASNGQVTFWTSSDGITWNQLGTTQSTTSGSIDNVSQLVEVGANTSGTLGLFNGRIFNVSIQTSVGGSNVVDFNPQSFNPSASQTQWTSATGEVWTINTSLNTTSANNNYKGALVYRNMIMADGIDDAMSSGNVTIGGQQVGIYSSMRVLNSVNALNTYLELSSASSTNNESFGIFNGDNNPLRRIYTRVRGTANREYTSTSDVFTSRLALHSVVIDTSLSTDISLFYNQSSIAANATGTDQSNSFTTSYPLYLFARNGNTLLSNMSLHDLMLVTDITKRAEMENIIRSMSSNFAF